MQENLTKLTFFPTPYPDEALYSVICRYHTRCGNKDAKSTSIAIWGKPYSPHMYLPGGLERITSRIPKETGITAEFLIKNTTLFPFLKPFLLTDKGEELFNALQVGNTHAYNFAGLPHTQLKQKCLYYCKECVSEDIKMYGEPYLHLVHQLPFMLVCNRHGILLSQSNTDKEGILPVMAVSSNNTKDYSSKLIEKAQALARDIEWLMKNGSNLDGAETLDALYNKWLLAKGFFSGTGNENIQKLKSSLMDFYGQEFLAVLNTQGLSSCEWVKGLLRNPSCCYPVQHLLLIQYLAGYVEAFFKQEPQNNKAKNIIPHIASMRENSRRAYMTAEQFQQKVHTRREEFMSFIKLSPQFKRHELVNLGLGTCYRWLYHNDRMWLNQHSHAFKLVTNEWEGKDAEYTEILSHIIKNELSSTSRPCRINFSFLSKQSGINNLSQKHLSGLLPNMTALIVSSFETGDAWHFRRLKWAAEQLRARNEVITKYTLLKEAVLSNKNGVLNDLIGDILKH